MVGQGFELRDPVWVDGKAVLKGTAYPRAVVAFAIFLGRVDGVVHEHQAAARFGHLVNFSPAFPNDAGAIGIDDDGFRAIEDGFIGGPTA